MIAGDLFPFSLHEGLFGFVGKVMDVNMLGTFVFESVSVLFVFVTCLGLVSVTDAKCEQGIYVIYVLGLFYEFVHSMSLSRLSYFFTFFFFFHVRNVSSVECRDVHRKRQASALYTFRAVIEFVFSVSFLIHFHYFMHQMLVRCPTFSFTEQNIHSATQRFVRIHFFFIF